MSEAAGEATGEERRPARIGWLSTGRDEAARRLLEDVVRRAASDGLPLDIACVFCDREPGEGEASDHFLETAQGLGFDVVTISSAASWRRWRERLSGCDVDPEACRALWREQFHDEVMWELKFRDLDVLVLAGYMLIASPQMCARYPLLNLHPALPGGPTGTWQEVIWELLRGRAGETGAMMHLATAELDRGPAIAFFRFPIRGGEWDALWREYLAEEERLGLDGVRDAVAKSARSPSSTRR
jgi:phosphoribosylglycinamide formyltransferase-1